MARECSYGSLDMIFGGHDHTYFRELSEDTEVFIQKSGTDFEEFSNVIALFDVSEMNYGEYIEQLKTHEKKPKDYDSSRIEVFYSKEHQRMYISERIPITSKFAPDDGVKKDVDFYL